MTGHRRNGVLLRITGIEDGQPGVTTLKVEGRLVADSVGVLEQECRGPRRDSPKIRLDFSRVTFIDGRGVDLLRRLRASGVEIANCPPFVECLLDATGDR